MAKSLFPSIGQNVYPSPTARNGEQVGVTPLRRCRQCGTPNDTRTTSWSHGLNENLDDGTETSESGCKFCGSLWWTQERPRKLPDDRYRPTPGIGKKNRG